MFFPLSGLAEAVSSSRVMNRADDATHCKAMTLNKKKILCEGGLLC